MLRPFLLHALSPLHAGTGRSADVIDLPIARMKGTDIPIAPGSGIKGVLRDARKEQPRGDNSPDWSDRHLATFGPDTNNAADHAGALIFGDARLLALPVRSFKGAFAWVTSPLLLTLAKRDLNVLDEAPVRAWTDLPIPQLQGRRAAVTTAGASADGIRAHDGKVYLQDLDLELDGAAQAALDRWAAKLRAYVSPTPANSDPNVALDPDIFTKRFAIVDDDTMAFLWETATQVDQRIRLNDETRTVESGALWREESLPPETLLIGIMEAGRSRRTRERKNGEEKMKSEFVEMKPEDVMKFALEKEEVLQFGGKATVGRGRCRMIPITA